MQPADNKFFEEYKRLDKLCSEMYSCQSGISAYICEMEDKAYQGQRRVCSWNSDYKMLKHVRWVRNQIAHDSGTYQISEPGDLTFVRNFCRRIFSGKDPLTLLQASMRAAPKRRRAQKKQHTHPASRPHFPPWHTPQSSSARSRSGVLLGIGVLALIVILFCLLS